MTNLVLGLLAETFIHSGTGRNEGAIDLPAAREAATDYPFIPGSSLKGALRDYARQEWPDKTVGGDENPDGGGKKQQDERVTQCFGKEGAEQAGGLLVSDARLLLLPVRSLNGAYKWATCPIVLERLRRDLERMNFSTVVPGGITVDEGNYLGKDEGQLYLEERVFKHGDDLPENLASAIGELVPHEETRARLSDQLVILSDKDFAWFARYALSVQARNVLDKNKKSKNLWYEESLPPDTLMYALIAERTRKSGIDDLQTLLTEKPWLQTGGNETVGMGWFALSVLSGEEG